MMKILSPAKVNLFLQVVGKRPDGYHDLVSLMCCVGLYDTVSLAFGHKEITISCDHPDVPEDKTNLAFSAANLFFEKLKKDGGVGITIEKKIPVAAGLGGGSSNAASVLLGLNRYYNYPISKDELMSMGLSIGADVPFFIFNQPAIARGVGEKLEAYQLPENLMFLLVCPGFGLSTAAVYKNLNLGLTKCKKQLSYTLLKMQGFDVSSHLCNDLETVVESKHPDISAAKEALLSHGAMGALMSGSGPTVFGLFSDPDKAQKARHALEKNDHWQIYLADIIT